MDRITNVLKEQYGGNAGAAWIGETKVADISLWKVKVYQEQIHSSSMGPGPKTSTADGMLTKTAFCNCTWNGQVLPDTFSSMMVGERIQVDLVLKDDKGKPYRATAELVLKKVLRHQGNIVLVEMDMNDVSELQAA